MPSASGKSGLHTTGTNFSSIIGLNRRHYPSLLLRSLTPPFLCSLLSLSLDVWTTRTAVENLPPKFFLFSPPPSIPSRQSVRAESGGRRKAPTLGHHGIWREKFHCNLSTTLRSPSLRIEWLVSYYVESGGRPGSKRGSGGAEGNFYEASAKIADVAGGLQPR